MLGVQGYEALRELGSGTFGTAVLVAKGGAYFVAKVQDFAHLGTTGRTALAREVQNMRQASAYDHPHLVRFRESFQDAGLLYIVMDYCDEQDLGVQIEMRRHERKQFEEALVQRWICELISGLDYLHYLKILHRDIKPNNIFISRGCAKLGDLGMSKEVSLGATDAYLHTQCGSPLYVAPEVHMGQPYSKSVDIWSLGCTLFQIMMLDFAFGGENTEEIMRNVSSKATNRHARTLPSFTRPFSRSLPQP